MMLFKLAWQILLFSFLFNRISLQTNNKLMDFVLMCENAIASDRKDGFIYVYAEIIPLNATNNF